MEASAAASLAALGERPPRALIEQPSLLAMEASLVADCAISWNERLRELRAYGLPGSPERHQQRKAIVVWIAAQERRQ